MKFKIPAKTFLLGEYAALQGGPAILLTTTPCFEVEVSSATQAADIHPDSPAGQFLKKAALKNALNFSDPYDGIGGLGASSAQFLGAYFAYLQAHQKTLTRDALLQAYWDASFEPGRGMRPSGYDVLAQAASGCVYLHHQQKTYQTYAWPFSDMAFILLHTGQKLATHEHLETLHLTEAVAVLSPIVDLGREAFKTQNSALLVQAVKDYHHQLQQLGLVAQHTEAEIERLSQHPDILGAKGCGALGADVVLLLVPQNRLSSVLKQLDADKKKVLATSRELFMTEHSERMQFTS